MSTTELLPHNTPTPDSDRRRNGALAVLAVIAMLGALKAAQVVVIPLFLAIFVAILVRPPLTFLRRFLPRSISLSIVLVGLLALIVGVWTFVASSVPAIAERAPAYYESFRMLLESWLALAADRGVPVTSEMFGTEEVFNWGIKVFTASLAPLATFLGASLLISFLLVLLLMETDELRPKLEKGLGEQRAAAFAGPVERVMAQFQRYFFTKTLISASTGLCTGLFTWALGIDFPYVWGTLAFLLNFIPNIGSIMAVVPPVLIAILQFSSVSVAAFTLAGLTALQLLIGNFIDPRIMGRSLSLSPFFLFASMVFWGWMWGVVGIFLAVPLTVLLRMVFEQYEPLRPIAVIMSGLERDTESAAVGATRGIQSLRTQPLPDP